MVSLAGVQPEAEAVMVTVRVPSISLLSMTVKPNVADVWPAKMVKLEGTVIFEVLSDGCQEETPVPQSSESTVWREAEADRAGLLRSGRNGWGSSTGHSRIRAPGGPVAVPAGEPQPGSP